MVQQGIRYGIMALLLLAMVMGAQGATLLVGPSGGDYAAIQPAVEAASPGDTIRVMAGTYPGGVVIRTPVTLVGEAGAVIGTVRIEADDVTIRSLSCGAMVFNGTSGSHVDGCVISAEETGIALSACRGCTIAGTEIAAGRTGIMIGSSDHTLLEGVLVSGGTTGVIIRESDGFSLRQTRISGTDIGIVAEHSGNGTLEGTTFTDVGAGVLGVGITDTRIIGSTFSGITQYVQLFRSAGVRVEAETLRGPDYFAADIFSDTVYTCGSWNATGRNFALLAQEYEAPEGYILHGEAMNISFIPEATGDPDPAVVLGAGEEGAAFYRVDGVQEPFSLPSSAEGAVVGEPGHYALMSRESAAAGPGPLLAAAGAIIAATVLVFAGRRKQEN
ncbi:MAG: right-handed parallel beta-helix repeat-containing protein [Methanomicrobiaceae archaeon]|nr:right-handed parallel beta-helix repeat-containing protein [Methanomicrobiaceae archaeon]